MKKERTAQLLKSNLASLRNHLAPISVLRLSSASNARYQRRADPSILTHKRNQIHPLSTFTRLQHRRPLYQFSNSSCREKLQRRPLSDSQGPKRSIHGINTILKALPHPPNTLHSSFGSWSAVAIAIVAVLIAYSSDSISSSKKDPSIDSDYTPEEVLSIEEFYEYIMPQENQVGRVGNLTPDQEEKLKQLWVATLRVFGVLEKESNDVNGTLDTADGKLKEEVASPDGKKPKKKRMSLFRRGDKDSASTKSSDSGTATPTAPVEDDKYGQTKEFHEALANQSPESLRATFWSMVKHDHPDALLLRFLRARKWDVDRALIMMVSTMKWRARDVHVDDDIVKNGELGALEDIKGSDPAKKKLAEDFLTQMRMGKSFFHGLDKEGRPMCFVRARLHKQGEQSEESLEKYTVFTIETGRMILAPPTDTACVIFDLTGFSMANMDYGPVKFMIKCFEANYPESLGVVLVHKAPWIFQGIWKIIRGWLDPVVASKVHFTNTNLEMEEFVPRSNIIKELGGDEDWEYKYIEPSPTENDAMKDIATRDKLLLEREATVDRYEKSTLEWVDGKEVKDERTKIAGELRDGYWILDPYVRARSYYDRVGLIGPGGKPQFYPQRGEPSPVPIVAAAAAPVNGAAKPVETSEADLD